MYCIVASVIRASVLRFIVERASARSTSPGKLSPSPVTRSDMSGGELTRRGAFPDIRGDRFGMGRGTVVTAHSNAVGAEQKQLEDMVRIVVFSRYSVQDQEAADCRGRAGQKHPSVGGNPPPPGLVRSIG